MRMFFCIGFLYMRFKYLRAENPPKSAPEAIPTQNPIVKPNFILSKQVGPCW